MSTRLTISVSPYKIYVLMLVLKGPQTQNCLNILTCAGSLVALRSAEDALRVKIRMFERSEFGFLRMFLADYADLSATWVRTLQTECVKQSL